jgi:hypothetical protein
MEGVAMIPLDGVALLELMARYFGLGNVGRRKHSLGTEYAGRTVKSSY